MNDTSRPSLPAWSALGRLLGRGAAAERLVLATVPQPIITVDVAEQLAFANPAAEALLGATLEATSHPIAIGRSLHDVLETLAADGGRVCLLCAALGEEGDASGEATVGTEDGRVPVRYTLAPLFERGERAGVVVALERQPDEAEAERRQRERGTREMQALLADLAHELNNPLTVILASAGMLREGVEGEANRRRVELVAEAAERCVGIIRAFRSSVMSRETPAAPDPAVVPVPATPARAKILVVDDDPLVASAIAAALAAEGHDVDTAPDGLAALNRISTTVYDAILTDVRMPRLDGPGFYRELGRQRPELLSRVAFVTGDILSPATQRFLETVSAPSVRKPFEPRHLRAVVRRLLAGERDRNIA